MFDPALKMNEKCKRNLFIWNYVCDLNINYGFLLLEYTLQCDFLLLLPLVLLVLLLSSNRFPSYGFESV